MQYLPPLHHCLSLFTVIALLLNTQTAFAQNALVIEATTPIQINANLPVNGDVTDFQISPDNQNAVYIADQNNDEVFELFSVRMDGSAAPIRLSLANPVSGGDVLEIIGFSPNGQRVIYSADQTIDEMDELLSVRLDGTSLLTLTPNFETSNSFRSLALSPDRNRVVYVPVTQGAGLIRHMFSVPVNGGTQARLTNNFPINAALTASDADFSRDSSKVIYRVITDGLEQLHIANTDGSGTALRLDADGDGEDRVFSYEISNDNQRVVYQADQNIDDQFELFSVAATGGPVVRLNTNLPVGAEVRDFRMNTLNSNFVYYIADQNALDREEMFSVNITGSGGPTRLSPAVTGDATVTFQSDNGNGDIISYIALDRSPTPFTFSFRGVSQSTNQDILISSPTASTDFLGVLESSSGQFVTFLTRIFGSGQNRLMSLELAENTDSRVLISENVSNGLSNSLRHISMNEQIVTYAAFDLVDPSLQNLFVTSLQFGGPVRLNPDLTPGAEIVQTLTSDDGGFALYRADQDNVGQFNLYASAISLNEAGANDLCFPIKTDTGAITLVCL